MPCFFFKWRHQQSKSRDSPSLHLHSVWPWYKGACLNESQFCRRGFSPMFEWECSRMKRWGHRRLERFFIFCFLVNTSGSIRYLEEGGTGNWPAVFWVEGRALEKVFIEDLSIILTSSIIIILNYLGRARRWCVPRLHCHIQRFSPWSHGRRYKQ